MLRQFGVRDVYEGLTPVWGGVGWDGVEGRSRTEQREKSGCNIGLQSLDQHHRELWSVHGPLELSSLGLK